MTGREVRVETDSTAATAEMIEMIRAELAAMIAIRARAMTAGRADQQTERAHMIGAEIAVTTEIRAEAMTAGRADQQTELAHMIETETAALIETEAMREAEIATEAQIRIEVGQTAEIENLVLTGRDQTREIDIRSKTRRERERKTGVTRTGTEEITVRGITTPIERKIAGNV